MKTDNLTERPRQRIEELEAKSLKNHTKLTTQLHYTGELRQRAERAEQQRDEYKKLITDYLAGDYQHPRAYRPNQCPHGRYHWEECCDCDEEFWTEGLDRIRAVGESDE